VNNPNLFEGDMLLDPEVKKIALAGGDISMATAENMAQLNFIFGPMAVFHTSSNLLCRLVSFCPCLYLCATRSVSAVSPVAKLIKKRKYLEIAMFLQMFFDTPTLSGNILKKQFCCPINKKNN
jgi:hypothetical protein